MSDSIQPKLKLLVTIIDRKMGKKLVEMYKSEMLIHNMLLMGRGTAESDLLDLLGLGETEKYVILTPITDKKLPQVLKRIKEEMKIEKAGHGIAFTVPVASVGGVKTFEYMSGIFYELIKGVLAREEGEQHG